MSETNPERAPTIYTGLEDPSHTRREKADIEAGWSIQTEATNFPEKLLTVDLDRRLADLIEQTKVAEKQELVVLDIGSGPVGSLINSFQDAEQWPLVHHALLLKPGLNLRAVGITSAQTGRQQGELLATQRISLTEADDSSQLTSQNYAYTITQKHRLAKFLESQGVPSLDLCLSTFGIGYFTPGNFESCLNDLADHLSPSGEFFGISWDWVPAGFKRNSWAGLLQLEANLPVNHPLKLVFDRALDGLEYYADQALSPESKRDRHLAALTFCVDKGLITETEACDLIVQLRPRNANFIYYHLDEIASAQELDLFKKVLARVIKFHPFLNAENWQRLEALVQNWRQEAKSKQLKAGEQDFSQLSKFRRQVAQELQPTLDKLLKQTLSISQQLKRLISQSFTTLATVGLEEVDEAIHDLRSKVMSQSMGKVTTPIADEVAAKTQAIITRLPELSWLEAVDYLASQDSFLVGEIWDWESVDQGLEQLIIEKTRQKTTQAKIEAIDRLAARKDVVCHWNKGNIYLGKRG